MHVRVVSKRAGGAQAKPDETVIYIGRPSVLGNPFPMKSEADRQHVVNSYRAWLEKMYQTNAPQRVELEALTKRAMAGEKLALQCWCAPCACHGDVIKEAIEAISKL